MRRKKKKGNGTWNQFPPPLFLNKRKKQPHTISPAVILR
jgi:hypothetical protein